MTVLNEAGAYGAAEHKSKLVLDLGLLTNDKIPSGWSKKNRKAAVSLEDFGRHAWHVDAVYL